MLWQGAGHARVACSTHQQAQEPGLEVGLVEDHWEYPAKSQHLLVCMRTGAGGKLDWARQQHLSAHARLRTRDGPGRGSVGPPAREQYPLMCLRLGAGQALAFTSMCEDWGWLIAVLQGCFN